MHGLPNVQRAGSWFRKVFWALVVITGLGVMSWQITEAGLKYITHPTETTVLYATSQTLDFPAVTICNLNPIRYASIGELDSAGELLNFFNDQFAEWDAEVPDENSSMPSDWDTWSSDYDTDYSDYDYASSYDADADADADADYQPQAAAQTDYEDPDANSDYFNDDDDYWNSVLDEDVEFAEDFAFATDALSMVSELSRVDRMRLGHSLTTMLITCTYRGTKCTPKDFKVFNHYLYGNCWTFNAGNNRTIRKTSKGGPRYGLTMELYIEQYEYIQGLADSAGLRVLVHNQTQMPFPEDDGLSIAPGTKTSIGINKRVMERPIPPWGTCKTHTKADNIKLNAYLSELDHIGYSAMACKKTCYQKELISSCGCYDPNFPFASNAKIAAYENLTTENVEPCTLSGNKEKFQACVKEAELKFINNTLGCNEACPVACQETLYPYSASFSAWPSQASQTRVMTEVMETSEYFWNIMEQQGFNEQAITSYIRDNFVKMDIYFKEMTVETIATRPSYLILDLISDLGGQAGLWVGVSIVAFFELIELVVDIFMLCCKRCGRPNKVDREQLVPKKKSQQESVTHSRPPSDTALPMVTY